jgi:hypothetical protein
MGTPCVKLLSTRNHTRVCFPRCIDGKKMEAQESAYRQGQKDHDANNFADANPFEEGTPLWHCWYEGWTGREECSSQTI